MDGGLQGHVDEYINKMTRVPLQTAKIFHQNTIKNKKLQKKVDKTKNKR